MHGGERSPVASRDGTKMKRSKSLATSSCAVQLGNRRRHAEPAGVDSSSQAALNFRKLFRTGEAGVPNASCCNRSSLSEITGNSSVSTHISPNSCVRRAELSCDEQRSQWTNAHTARSTQIQLSTWPTRPSPRHDLARRSPLGITGSSHHRRAQPTSTRAAYSRSRTDPGPTGYEDQLIEEAPVGTNTRPPPEKEPAVYYTRECAVKGIFLASDGEMLLATARGHAHSGLVLEAHSWARSMLRKKGYGRASPRFSLKLSKLGLKKLEYTYDMRVSLGLLGNSQNGGASPWDVVAVVLQVIGGWNSWIMYPAVGRSQPLARRAG